MKLSIRNVVIFVSAVIVLSITAAITISSNALSDLRIGGTLYPKLKDGNDLLADVMPPPLFVVEPYMEALQAKIDSKARDAHIKRISQLEKDFASRKAYWVGHDFSPEQIAALDRAVKAGEKFFADFNAVYVPALRSGDPARVESADALLFASYQAQRQAVDELVSMHTRYNDAYQYDVNEQAHSATLLVTISALLSGILLIGGILALIMKVIMPLTRLTTATGQISGGAFRTTVPSTNRKDELGALAGAVENFRKAALAQSEKSAEQSTVVEMLANGLKQLAAGNLSQNIDQKFPAEYEQLRADFNSAVGQLRETIQRADHAAATIRTGANEIAQASDDLSRRTEQQAASLEETAAALEEITATVRQTAQNAKEASTIVSNAKGAAETSGKVVDTAIQAMTQIEQSSKHITDIIGVIDEIAFQTNLLALNAGVEAARAGDAGRGFAVVASEVRALAQRSSEAAKEIRGLIRTSGEHVGQGVRFVGETGESLKQIAQQVVNIDLLVSEIAKAAQQQSTGIEEVNIAVGQMDQVTQQNAAMVEESTAASRNLATETSELSKQMAFFKTGSASRAIEANVEPVASKPKHTAPAPVRARPRVSGNLALSEPQADDWTEF